MAYSLALLLILIVSSVQGYHNSSSYGRYDHSNRVSKEEHLSQFKAQEFDKVFRMYRADFNGRREPRFVSFQTKDDNIEVEIDFAIPFLSIPVKRSLSGAMGTFQNVIKVRVKVTKVRKVLKWIWIAGNPDGECERRRTTADRFCDCGRSHDRWNIAAGERWKLSRGGRQWSALASKQKAKTWVLKKKLTRDT